MTRATLTMGVDAHVRVKIRFIHPSELIRAKFINPVRGQELQNLIVTGRGERVINRKTVPVIFMRHPTFHRDGEELELYTSAFHCKVTKEGPSNLFFGVVEAPEHEEAVEAVGERIPVEVFQSRNDVEFVRAAGVQVDDDNEPAPENLPTESNPSNSVFSDWSSYDGICPRRVNSTPNVQPSLLRFPQDTVPTKLQLFEKLFFKHYVLSHIIPAINEIIGINQVSYPEFLQWLGVWLLMSCIQGFKRRDFWATTPTSAWPEQGGAPWRFNQAMTRNRFEAILSNIKYTTNAPPAYRDRFWEVRDMLRAFNENMLNNFTPSTMNCLDESMSVWTNEYTCPGFMFVPRKPHPFGNEYHTICCCESGVLYRLELVEGKDRPVERGPKLFDQFGKTVGLLLRLTEPLWGSGKIVILDSGFCVLEGIAQLKAQGVYAAAQIKKRRYWPKHVDGEAIKSYFFDKEVGSVACLPGSLNGCQVFLHCMKEPEYVTMLMSSYGTLERRGKGQVRNWVDNGTACRAEFQYPEVVYNHYNYRHHIDDHNNRRHQPISIEDTWSTHSWAHRVFGFLLAVTEQNVFLMNKRFNVNAENTILEFRRKFGLELIHNVYIRQRDDSESPPDRRLRRRSNPLHSLQSLPKNKKFSGCDIVDARSAYPQNRCSSCRDQRVRTYCACSPGIYLCSNCFTGHVRDSSNAWNT